jgi:hypothetical protein
MLGFLEHDNELSGSWKPHIFSTHRPTVILFSRMALCREFSLYNFIFIRNASFTQLTLEKCYVTYCEEWASSVFSSWFFSFSLIFRPTWFLSPYAFLLHPLCLSESLACIIGTSYNCCIQNVRFNLIYPVRCSKRSLELFYRGTVLGAGKFPPLLYFLTTSW